MSDVQGRGGRQSRRVQVRASIDEGRGVFMISVAAELAEMHPQTLRMYEARGLVNPQRSPKNTRLYSQRDVEQLRRIQELTTEQGLNLAGVEAVLDLEQRLDAMQREVERFRSRANEIEQEMAQELERVRRSFRAEIVPYTPPDPGSGPVRIPVEGDAAESEES